MPNYDIGPRQDKVLVASFQGRAAEIGRGQMPLLDQSAYRAVEHKDASS
jgi:hypothetical protein